MEISAEVLSNFSSLMADHMAREECYYLHKIAESAGGSSPKCDPGKQEQDHKKKRTHKAFSVLIILHSFRLGAGLCARLCPAGSAGPYLLLAVRNQRHRSSLQFGMV